MQDFAQHFFYDCGNELLVGAEMPEEQVYTSENIRALRWRLGLNQAQLADRIDTTSRTVSSWETGERGIRLGHMRALADFFGVSISDLRHRDLSAGFDSRKDGVSPAAYTAPLYAEISAAVPMEEAMLEDRIPVPGGVLDDHPRGFFLRISDASMSRVMAAGSYAFVDPDADVRNGDVAAVAIGDDAAIIRRYHRLSDRVVLRPDSTDRVFEDVAYPVDTPHTVFGRVVRVDSPLVDRL